MKKEKKDSLLNDVVYLVIVAIIIYIVGFSKYSLFQNVSYSQVDIITKEDLMKQKEK